MKTDAARQRVLCWLMVVLASLAFAIAVGLAGCAQPMPPRGGLPDGAKVPGIDRREDVLVLRSVREERIPESTWCSAEQAGFTPLSKAFLIEDRFTMWSVTVQPRDGRIDNAKVAEVGTLRTCFGLTPDPKVINFHAAGQIASQALSGNGQCLLVRADFPEKGLSSFHCHLALRGLAAPYVGGVLTTNSLVSKALLGAETDPPGYAQTSIATIRLWRAR